MKLYHGTSYEKAVEIIKASQFQAGYQDNPWSSLASEDGLFCSNVFEYAEQYGTTVIKIEVTDDDVLFIQDCPIDENDFGWKPEFFNAAEYLIPDGVRFSAHIIA